jgi:hypothetical protein
MIDPTPRPMRAVLPLSSAETWTFELPRRVDPEEWDYIMEHLRLLRRSYVRAAEPEADDRRGKLNVARDDI